MKKSRKSILTLITVCVLLFSAGAVFFHREALLEKGLEYSLNKSTHEFLKGSVRLRKVRLDSKLRIYIEGFYGELQTEGGPLPLVIRSIHSMDSLSNLAFGRPVRFIFEGARPARSNEDGLTGKAAVRLGKEGFMEIEADILSLGLGNLEKLNPENLEGSTGQLNGKFYFRSAGDSTDFELLLKVPAPGGLIQARFFDAVLPYLPQIPNRAKIEQIAGTARLVPYKDADLKMELIDPSRMKVFFHILVPDYNLNLNLNMEIRVDRENAFFEIAQMMGLIKVSAS